MEGYREASTIRRVGLVGGTFDPVHYGHLVIAEEIRFTLKLTEMVFIPAGQPPHKPQQIITAVQHRMEMLQLAIASNPYFTCSRIEVDQPGPSYTVDTLRRLREEWGINAELYFVVGWDSLEEFSTWYKPMEILALLTRLVAIRRPGYVEDAEYNARLESRLPGISQRLLVMPAPQLEISSSDLRQRVAEGRPITYQTPEVVEQYITEHKLYSG